MNKKIQIQPNQEGNREFQKTTEQKDGKKCKIIEDLLPLYVEHMTSEESAKWIEEHLNECEDCKSQYLKFKREEKTIEHAEALPLLKLKHTLLKKKMLHIAFTMAFVLFLVSVILANITQREYFAYSKDLFEIKEYSDDTVLLSFSEEVSSYSVELRTNELGTDEYYVSAWTSEWDRWFHTYGRQNVQLKTKDENARPIPIFYNPNQEKLNVLVYGVQVENGGSMMLPRLAMGYYFVLALQIGAVIIVLTVIIGLISKFRGRSHKFFMLMLKLSGLAPSYVIAHLMNKGLNYLTYSMQRDFYFNLFTGAMFYVMYLILVHRYGEN